MENVDVGSGNPDRRGSSRDGRNTYRSAVMKEAWERWVQKEIYGGNAKPGYIFPTEGSHYQAFKAGWEAAMASKGDE